MLRAPRWLWDAKRASARFGRATPAAWVERSVSGGAGPPFLHGRGLGPKDGAGHVEKGGPRGAERETSGGGGDWSAPGGGTAGSFGMSSAGVAADAGGDDGPGVGSPMSVVVGAGRLPERPEPRRQVSVYQGCVQGAFPPPRGATRRPVVFFDCLEEAEDRFQDCNPPVLEEVWGDGEVIEGRYDPARPGPEARCL